MLGVISPSTLSKAVAKGRTIDCPAVAATSELANVITGAVVSAIDDGIEDEEDEEEDEEDEDELGEEEEIELESETLDELLETDEEFPQAPIIRAMMPNDMTPRIFLLNMMLSILSVFL